MPLVGRNQGGPTLIGHQRIYMEDSAIQKALHIVFACYYSPGAHPADATEGRNRAFLAPSPCPGSSHHPMSYNCGPCRRENRQK